MDSIAFSDITSASEVITEAMARRVRDLLFDDATAREQIVNFHRGGKLASEEGKAYVKNRLLSSLNQNSLEYVLIRDFFDEIWDRMLTKLADKCNEVLLSAGETI